MKTNNENKPFGPNQSPAVDLPIPAGASTHRLSEKAFYLIVLAHLLKESIGSNRLRDLLIPGKYVWYGRHQA
jgi:hypothetical protein